jgi:hypothetical protein
MSAPGPPTPGTFTPFGDDAPPGDPSLCWHIVHTADDERVCPVCAPLDGELVNGADVATFPPLHTNCRCWLELAQCEEPPEPPLLPPEPGPGPGPF